MHANSNSDVLFFQLTLERGSKQNKQDFCMHAKHAAIFTLSLSLNKQVGYSYHRKQKIIQPYPCFFGFTSLQNTILFWAFKDQS